MTDRQTRVVLDTNVALDWLVFRDARVAPLMQALAAGRVHAVAIPAMRIELAEMLGSRRLLRWAPDATTALAAYDQQVRIIDGPLPPLPDHRPRCSDTDDQIFIDLALALPARWLLTHDRALLKLAPRLRRLSVEVLTPMAWATAAA